MNCTKHKNYKGKIFPSTLCSECINVWKLNRVSTFSWSKYQKQCLLTAVYPNKGNNIHYPFLGLINETAEFIEKLLKNDIPLNEIDDEFGDILWYYSVLAYEFNESTINYSLPLNKQNRESFNIDTLTRNIIKGYVNINNISLTNIFNSLGLLAGYVKKLERDYNGKIYDSDKRIEIYHCFRDTMTYIIKYYEDERYKFDDADDKINFSTQIVIIAVNNNAKLMSRKIRNKLHGSGDKR